ncbi:peptidase M1 [Luteipulveratus mongoliensis]|uniref:Aminopeptidase N n=1 Tax=Luteipulveratus mongoliensis TaxID=571913 RepID=A0A0K1JQX0_9MICO|nr:peptidase M1 [Luteipulveratus mongoliensis]
MLAAVAVGGCDDPTPQRAPSSPTMSPSPASSPGPADIARWAAGRSDPVPDTIYPSRGNAGLDVLHYGLDLTWSQQTRTLTGTAALQLRATADLPRITLDFLHDYVIDSVTVNGKSVSGSTSPQDKLTVPTPLTKDAAAAVVVRYHGTPRPIADPSKRTDIEPLGLTVTPTGELWTMQEPYGALTWYPVNDQPSDKALYDIAVTAPAGWVGVASGTPAGTSGQTNRYTTTDPVSSYLTTVAVGPFKKEEANGPRGLPLTYWVRPQDADELEVARESPAMIAWLEQRFGPYPFASGGLVVVDSRSAMETQQLVTMGQMGPVGIGRPRFERNLLHEYAHQWFGDTVSPKTWKDVWLNEGWAYYAQVLWQQDKDHTPNADLDQMMLTEDAADRKESGPPGTPRADSFAARNVYTCAAAMLHQIRKTVGDTAFFTMARGWSQEHRNGSADRATFIAYVNKSTGRDLTALINTWLDSTTQPRPVT